MNGVIRKAEKNHDTDGQALDHPGFRLVERGDMGYYLCRQCSGVSAAAGLKRSQSNRNDKIDSNGEA
jgi:hypothetical protein